MTSFMLLVLVISGCCSANFIRDTLNFVQQANWGQCANDYRLQQGIWSLLDHLNETRPDTKPYLLLGQVVNGFTVRHESIMAKNNDLERFREVLKGIVPPIQPSYKGVIILSRELLDVLDQPIKAKILMLTMANKPISEDLLTKVEHPLRRIYVLSAYAHFKTYMAYQVRIDPMNPLNYRNTPNPIKNINNRMALLRSAMSSLFSVESQIDTLLLGASWSLAQYLSYISRLYPGNKDEIGILVREYFGKLHSYLVIFS